MNQEQSGLSKYLSFAAAWALSFGCTVGWGAFVMPGTTFLPVAGSVGTALGMCVGAVIMLIIGVNYHYMMKQYQDAGGTFSYTKQVFGYDHGFLSAWFLSLTYIAIVWANVTALALIARTLFGSLLLFGFHYALAGYDIYFGEVALEIAVLFIATLLCIYTRRLAALLQTVCAAVLLIAVAICFVAVLQLIKGDVASFAPAFSAHKSPFMQICSIVALMPWAFVGFESVSHSAGEYKFPVSKNFVLLVLSVVASLFVYIILTLVAACARTGDFTTWQAYLENLPAMDGVMKMPVFFVVQQSLGKTGVVLLGFAVFAAILTGIIGNSIAASRLLYAMASDDILPAWFKQLGKHKTPKNALLFIAVFYVVMPFLGRTAISWIVDVVTIGATIAYGYTSAAAYHTARLRGNAKIQATGIIGIITAVLFSLFLLVPNLWSFSALSAESYLILAFWSLLGFLFFRLVFRHDTQRRFGKSTVVWIALLFLIFFTSIMWMRQSTHAKTDDVLDDIHTYYVEELAAQGIQQDKAQQLKDEAFLENKMDVIQTNLLHNSVVQMLLIVIALVVMFNIYGIIRGREKQMEREKAQAEESSKAKTIFLSNMSHDIRTPMNAIIGYIHLAKRKDIPLDEIKSYLSKIESSSQHLLALINDVLEMSRIESGKMELEAVPCSLRKILDEVHDMFATQMATKHIAYTVSYSGVTDFLVLCDKNRINRVLLNLISNAYKFTPEDGTISVTLSQTQARDGLGFYELRVKDSGIGMTKEFAAKVFEAFERERTSTVSGIQGTGLGMAITKSIIDLMGGDIQVKTAPNKGTEFIVTLVFALQESAAESTPKSAAESTPKSAAESTPKSAAESTPKSAAESTPKSAAESTPKSAARTMRLLLVEDVDINREIATMILAELGYTVEEAHNGKEAVEKVSAASEGYYDAVLMDIQMPVMNGYEASLAIRALSDKNRAAVPIIAMTANAFAEDIQKAKEVGMNAHVAKPIDVAALQKTLEEVLA